MIRYIRIILVAVLVFFIVNPSLVQAQDDGENSEEPGEGIIDWDEIDEALEPLENIQLEPPTLSTGEHGELQTWLSEGETAPWKGVLLNSPAAAFILTEYEAVQARARAALERQRASDLNRLRLEVGRLRLQLHSEREQAEIRIEGLRNEVNRLEDIHQALIDETSNNFWDNFLKIGGGVLGGIAVGIVVGFLATGN